MKKIVYRIIQIVSSYSSYCNWTDSFFVLFDVDKHQIMFVCSGHPENEDHGRPSQYDRGCDHQCIAENSSTRPRGMHLTNRRVQHDTPKAHFKPSHVFKMSCPTPVRTAARATTRTAATTASASTAGRARTAART